MFGTRQIRTHAPASKRSGRRKPASAPRLRSAAKHAYVSVHNDCAARVRVFHGRVNGRYTGGGTYGWHSENTTSSYSLSGDDELCIVENDRDVISCTKPEDGARLEISRACSGFTRR